MDNAKGKETQEKQLVKNINDLFLQTSSFEFYKKIKNIMMDYFKPSCEDLQLITQYSSFLGDINDERIKKYKVLNHFFNMLGCCKYIPEAYFNQISFDEDDPNIEELLLFWRMISRKVELKQVLGFPLCVYSNRTYKSLLQNNKKYYMYFLKNPTKTTTSFYSEIDDKEIFLSEIFQKILIFYELYKHGLTSQNYIFEVLENKTAVKTTFKIMDLVFSLPIKNIIILSPRTNLIPTTYNNPSEYFSSLEENEINNLTNIEVDTFPEFLIINFSQFFQKNLYNHKSLNIIAEMSPQILRPVAGKLYLMRKEESRNYIYTILLNNNSTHTTLLYIFDSTIPNTLSLSTQTFNNNDLSKFVFFLPNFLFDTSIMKNFIGTK